MSRAGSNIQYVKPSNNVYTVLVIIAFLAQVAAAAILFLKYTDIFKGNIFQS
jgi:hypothetical protein